MMQYNQYVSQQSPASMEFVLALQELFWDDIDMMRFLYGYGQ